MIRLLEEIVTRLWNRIERWRRRPRSPQGGTDLGLAVADGEAARHHLRISLVRRTMHIAILGKTGSGKSSLIRHLIRQDVEAGRGFVLFDVHGAMTPYALRVIALHEWQSGEHLHERVILIAPADRESSVGFNPLELPEPDFVRIAEFTEILRQRWGLDGFGARTEELLRNSLYALSANGLTLLELAPLLTNAAFRTKCLKNVPNAEVRSYFEIQSVGTHIFFQLSTNDAPQIAQALDGGKSFAERLKNLPQRHFVVKSGADHWREGAVPEVEDPEANPQDLMRRAQEAHARPRAEIEREITQRHEGLRNKTDEAIDDWE